MRKYLLLLLSTFISTVYTVLVIFSITGLGRNNIFDVFISYMSIDNTGLFLVAIIILCVIVNILMTIFLMKKKWQKKVSFFLCVSFVCGCLFILVIIQNHVISEFLYNTYVNLFYQGMHYVGEGKAQQVISYIPRIMTLSFIIGGMLSYVLVMVRKIKP